MGCAKHHGPPPRGDICPRINFLSKLVRQGFNEVLANEGLFSGQEEILFVLQHNCGITLRELSERLDITPATASKSVKRMEKTGFIIKKPDEKDARIIRLYPTIKAMELPERIKEKMDTLENTLKTDMADSEVLLLSDLLERAINNLKKGDEKDA